MNLLLTLIAYGWALLAISRYYSRRARRTLSHTKTPKAL